MGEFSNFEELKEAIAEWVARSDLAERLPSFIRLCEVRVQRDLKMRLQDGVSTGTFTAGQPYIDEPTDYVSGRFLRIDTNPTRKARVVSFDKLEEIRQADVTGGIPIALASHLLRLYVAPTPASAHGYTLFYHAGVPRLSEDNPTNELLDRAPDMLLWGSCLYAGVFLEDEAKIQMFTPLYEDAARSVKRQEWRARASNGPLRMRPEMSA